MTDRWNWPGARWWRLDLHAHSPESYDFKPREDRDQRNWQRWVQSAIDAGLDAIAVTDHNTAAGIQHLNDAIAGFEGSLVLFPAVEATASCGTHLLLVFDPSHSQQHVQAALAQLGISVDVQGSQDALSSMSIIDILDEIGDDAVVIGAHINCPDGILKVHEGQPRLQVLNNRRLAAVEVNPDHVDDEVGIDEDEMRLILSGQHPGVSRQLATLWCSDSHSHQDLGRRYTWVKMTRPTLEGLRLALYDGEDSVRVSRRTESGDPNERHASLAVQEIRISGAKYIGRRSPLVVDFNPWLNTIIGGRGTGKSTLVDFLRKAARRDFELDGSNDGDEGSLRSVFDRRMSIYRSRHSEGLATENTEIEVLYRKDNEQYILSWNPQGATPSIYRVDGEERIEGEGDITELFPIRIYSQKQLFALAQDPDALLTVIDQSPVVNELELARGLAQKRDQYLSLCSQARAARTAANGLTDRRAVMKDIERKLTVLQDGDNAKTLSEYRTRRQHEDTWQAIQADTSQRLESLEGSANELSVADMSLEVDNDEDRGQVDLLHTHEAVRSVIENLKRGVLELVRKAREDIEEINAGPNAANWKELLAQSEAKFADLSAHLREEGVGGLDEYETYLQQTASLRREIDDLDRESDRAEVLEVEAQSVLEEYRSLRDELSKRRASFLQEETKSDLIKVQISKYGNSDLMTELAESLGIERFEGDRKAIADRIMPDEDQRWDWDNLDNVVAAIRKANDGASVPWTVKDHRFADALAKLSPERVDRLALYLPRDAILVKYRDQQREQWKDLSQGSPGQQTAALLAFVLGYGNEPIVLDQPEDDLDNTLIYDLLVSRLREAKVERQIIVVTHNPNIVVHGDTEYLISLKNASGESHIACRGGLQELKVREEVCRVMEGGTEAFERRFQRIMPRELWSHDRGQ